jgi:hypothetical protein
MKSIAGIAIHKNVLFNSQNIFTLLANNVKFEVLTAVTLKNAVLCGAL